jgi:ABC-2 type transport system permease protein
VYCRSGAGGVGSRSAPGSGGRHHHRVRRVGFAINFVAQAWSTVSFLRFLSPFHYYTPADALVSDTVPVGSLAVLLAVFVAGVALAGWLLARRDLAL